MARRKTILIVHADADVRAALAEQFREGDVFAVLEAGDAPAALASLSGGDVDLAIVDDSPPVLDGRALCATMRDSGAVLPLILLTQSPGAVDCGTVETLTKPFRLGDLLGRVRARLRADASGRTLRIGPYLFDPGRKLLSSEDRTLRLTEKECDILEYLLQSAPAPVSREDLLHDVWGYHSGVTTHTLETHIYRLRQKIEPDPADARLLLTEAGGYRLEP